MAGNDQFKLCILVYIEWFWYMIYVATFWLWFAGPISTMLPMFGAKHDPRFLSAEKPVLQGCAPCTRPRKRRWASVELLSYTGFGDITARLSKLKKLDWGYFLTIVDGVINPGQGRGASLYFHASSMVGSPTRSELPPLEVSCQGCWAVARCLLIKWYPYVGASENDVHMAALEMSRP